MSVDLDFEKYKGSFISVEYAKSNKAKCRVCNTLIDKGALRIGAYYEPPYNADQYSIFKWHHLNCYKYLDGAMVDLNNYEVEDIKGFSKLKKEDKETVKKHIEDLQSSGTFKKKKIKFRDDDDDDDEDEDFDQKKKSKKQTKKNKDEEKKTSSNGQHKGYDDNQYKKFCDFKEKLKCKKNDYLKEQLKLNLQSYSQYNKDQLIEKVADGLTLGAIGKCPKCFGGRPKFNYQDGTYYCSGYQDDEEYLKCQTTFQLNEVERTEWKSSD